MDSKSRAEFEREVLDAWTEYESGDGLALRLRVVVASATKAAA
jgi:hypothetical protein